MEKSNETIRKNPKIDEIPTDIRTPSGAFQDALLVSSDKCADASKPVRSLQISGCPEGHINAPEWQQATEFVLLSSWHGTTLTCDGILAHQDPSCCYVSRRCSCGPARVTSPIVESSKDEFTSLVGWSFSQNGDSKAADTNRMQDN